MSLNELEGIKKEFIRLGLHPTYLEHAPVITSEDAERVSGFELKQGIKAILFTDGKGNWVIADIPGDKKVDQKKVAATLNWTKRDIRMATIEEVLEITGCEVGSVPPFGHKTKVPILVDTAVCENSESAFNIGLRTHTVLIPTEEMKIVFREAGATEGDFVKMQE
jgi:Ala-tRNA(Pro) deacylase